ncbi:hypothetical protein LY90DRAFT_520071 [Neocallimastix californiae]|uniref:Uncharacterized protein n=1 Tax=Neocallimastix californiae TaxID=1754190 RepID=A0A1Y1YIQ0_9FUNG|nr:hypothetical protein LY90DRAFT_520071 [Neocallimastix californiae]|eukprot:ORX97494.1 hypothetical protein LY90DRAFT_520071 [Neocallimastix californiae]
MTLLKYLITNEYFSKDFISILVKNQYVFSVMILIYSFKNFNLLILTFEQIRLFNKDIENKNNNTYDNNNDNNSNINNKKRQEKVVKLQKIKEMKMKRKLMKKMKKMKKKMYLNMKSVYHLCELFKYEPSEERCRGLEFFDFHFKYLDKKHENDIKLQFLYDIINKHVEIPKFQHENKKEFINEIYLRNQFNRILIRKHELYSKIFN